MKGRTMTYFIVTKNSSVFLILFLCSSASENWSAARSLFWRTAPPAGRARPRSWLWSACTSCICLGGARPRSSSHATSGKGHGTASESPSVYCAGTSCIGARPPGPSLWCCGQNHLHRNKINVRKCVSHRSVRAIQGALFYYTMSGHDVITDI